MYKNIYSSILQNSPKLETIQLSIKYTKQIGLCGTVI